MRYMFKCCRRCSVQTALGFFFHLVSLQTVLSISETKVSHNPVHPHLHGLRYLLEKGTAPADGRVTPAVEQHSVKSLVHYTGSIDLSHV